MMKAARLKPQRIRSVQAPELTLPERDPLLNRAPFISWSAEKVDVIRHDQVESDQPGVSFLP